MLPDVLNVVFDGAGPEGNLPSAPRFQWRAFTRGSIWALRVAPFLSGPREHAITDIYLLSAHSPHSVKLSEHHIDVRELECVTPEGLELWRHSIRLEYPLGARQIVSLFKAWGIDEPGPLRPCWSVRQFEHEIIDPRPALLSMPVVKQRTCIEVMGCKGEYVDLLVMGELRESVMLEHVDERLARSAAAALGLDQFPNTSYPTALRAMAALGEPAMRLEFHA